MIKKITVLGMGTMGNGIAHFFAQQKIPVIGYDISEEMINKARNRLIENESLCNYLSFTSDLKQAVWDADLIIESVPEELDIKKRIYSLMAPYLKPNAVVSSNTSTYPLSVLAFNQSFSDRMLITHFFNPAQIIPLVEIVKVDNTEPMLVEMVSDFFKKCGKKPVILKKECKGFIANRLQAAVLREACFLAETGVSDIQDIDTVMKEGLGPRWAFSGPFEISDFGGLDIWEKVCSNLIPDLCSELSIPRIIKEKVSSGATGLKAGKGFYNYYRHDAFQEKRDFNLIKLFRLKDAGNDKK
jgi:3-hydroxybutyryl-CoA dehydrogenase